ncbi:MAG: SoxR reducing system RseC family protein [Methylophilaceae bacterium]
MIEENAIVVDLENDMAMLEVIRRTPCGLCGQTRGCGISLWGRLFGHRNNVFKAINRVNARIGDNVIVGINEQALLMSALTLYGIPLLTTLAGALVGAAFPGENSLLADRHAAFGALAGLVAGLLWLKVHSSGLGLNSNYQPVILRVGASGSIQLNCTNSSK